MPSVKSLDYTIQIGTPLAFRGITDIILIPFERKGEIEATDKRLGYAEGLEDIEELASNNALLYKRKFMPRGASSYLFYGRAGTAESLVNADKATNGSLLVEGLPLASQPLEINFSPDVIPMSENGSTKAAALQTYLRNIASANSGGITFAQGYPDIFELFVNSGRLMSGSSEAILLLIQRVYDELRKKSNSDLKTAIINQIKKSATITNNIVSFTYNNLQDYPGTGLPQGCVALRWDGSRFQMNPTIAYLTSPEMICYPAELWYFDNSRIKTTEGLSYASLKEKYDNTSNNWETLLSFYTHDGTIRPETTGAALVKPVQYGVGLFEVTVAQIGTASLRDRKEANIPVNDNTKNLKVIGLIVGGQHPLSFDFTPQDGSTEYFSYDTQFSHEARITSNTGFTGPLFTTVLESPVDATIPFALECRNNTGKTIEGVTGNVLPGGVFYLVGQLDLSKLESADRTRDGQLIQKVFEQDHKTSVTVSVADLKNAYNVLPDLRQPRLQVGLTVEFDWVMSTPNAIGLK